MNHFNYIRKKLEIMTPINIEARRIVIMFQMHQKNPLSLEQAKQCAISCQKEKIQYAKTFGDVATQDIHYFEQLIQEIKAL